jgi:hypothetical protein
MCSGKKPVLPATFKIVNESQLNKHGQKVHLFNIQSIKYMSTVLRPTVIGYELVLLCISLSTGKIVHLSNQKHNVCTIYHHGTFIHCSYILNSDINSFEDSPFWTRSQNCEKRLLASSCQSVCPSVRMEQLCTHLTDFQKNLIFEYFRKSVEKMQVPLKFDKNNGYLTWIPMNINDNVSLMFA